jgi:hypothetical protein
LNAPIICADHRNAHLTSGNLPSEKILRQGKKKAQRPEFGGSDFFLQIYATSPGLSSLLGAASRFGTKALPHVRSAHTIRALNV